MKKTILLFLTSVSCVLLNACYATPEMKPNEYKISYDGGDGVCSAQSEYQHEGLRNCIEQGIAYENSNKNICCRDYYYAQDYFPFYSDCK